MQYTYVIYMYIFKNEDKDTFETVVAGMISFI